MSIIAAQVNVSLMNNSFMLITGNEKGQQTFHVQIGYPGNQAWTGCPAQQKATAGKKLNPSVWYGSKYWLGGASPYLVSTRALWCLGPSVAT